MSITGIICEYNPFHNGHKYLIEQHKQKYPHDYIIAVMSGNFTQRGEIALLDKWQRANLAVLNGVDLVLELPFVFAVRSAEFFAQGGIDLLKNLNCVDTLCFGSEYTDSNSLYSIAKTSLSPQFKDLLKIHSEKGLSYAAATSSALAQLTNISEDILKSPNTILGIEYLKAIIKSNADIKANIISRTSAGHNDIHYQEKFASGTAIRHSLYTNNINFSKLKQVVPEETFFALQEIYQKQDLPDLNYLFRTLITKIRLAKLENLRNIYGIREGLEYKLIQSATQSTSYHEFLTNLKSKRYPLTNLQRLLLYLLLDINKDFINTIDDTGPLYARILAFNQQGTQLLKKLKKSSSIPLITKTTTFLDSKKRCQNSLTTFEEMLAIDTYATELYNLCFNDIHSFGKDFTSSPIYSKNNY